MTKQKRQSKRIRKELKAFDAGVKQGMELAIKDRAEFAAKGKESLTKALAKLKENISKPIPPKKRILSVTLKRMIDDSPDTSCSGEYSNTAKTEYAIDRVHSEDCASVRKDIKQAKQTLEHVQQAVADLHNAVLAQYNGTLANEKLDAEKDALCVTPGTLSDKSDTSNICSENIQIRDSD